MPYSPSLGRPVSGVKPPSPQSPQSYSQTVCCVVVDLGGGGVSVTLRTVSPVFLMFLLLHLRQLLAVCLLNLAGFGFLVDPGWPFCPPGRLAASPAGFLARMALF